jgi:hypothetical protein
MTAMKSYHSLLPIDKEWKMEIPTGPVEQQMEEEETTSDNASENIVNMAITTTIGEAVPEP